MTRVEQTERGVRAGTAHATPRQPWGSGQAGYSLDTAKRDSSNSGRLGFLQSPATVILPVLRPTEPRPTCGRPVEEVRRVAPRIATSPQTSQPMVTLGPEVPLGNDCTRRPPVESELTFDSQPTESLGIHWPRLAGNRPGCKILTPFGLASQHASVQGSGNGVLRVRSALRHAECSGHAREPRPPGILCQLRFFRPRARTARRAISRRSSGGTPSQRALPPLGPPFLPPFRPRATAWGFFLRAIVQPILASAKPGLASA